jgi:hypothetical protein
MKRRTTVAVAMAALVALAGCSSPSEPADTPNTSTPPLGGPRSVDPVSVAGSIEHAHNLALVDGDTLVIGTHDGIWQQQGAGEAVVQVGDAFDVMGFAAATDRWLASGHPSPETGGPADLGLLASTDAGRTWEPVSLEGEVDFHRITTSEDIILGVNSGDGLLWRSQDAGLTWQTLGAGPFDVALDPADSARAVATTEGGPITSDDGGLTWIESSSDPLIGLVAWTAAGIYGVDQQGRVYLSTDRAMTWDERGRVEGQPSALAADGQNIVVLAEGTVWNSDDGGQTFAPRVDGVGA